MHLITSSFTLIWISQLYLNIEKLSTFLKFQSAFLQLIFTDLNSAQINALIDDNDKYLSKVMAFPCDTIKYILYRVAI